jgi:hypothetical protein
MIGRIVIHRRKLLEAAIASAGRDFEQRRGMRPRAIRPVTPVVDERR